MSSLMRMRHPSPDARPWFITATAAFFVVAAFGIYLNITIRQESAGASTIALISMLLDTAALSALCGLIGWVLLNLVKGPAAGPIREVRDQRWQAFYAAGLGALVVDAITVHALIAYTEGKILSMPAFVVASAILLAFFLLTHGLLVLSAIAVFLRGASRIVLDSEPATIGGRFTGILEIPFPASPAPRFEATLKLMRSVSDSIETGPFASVVWSEKMTLTDWKPAGKKRACAPFRFDLDMPPPDSQPGEYTWDLLIRSIDAKRPYSTVFMAPIKI